VTAPECRKFPTPNRQTCIERLAGGWILPTDLCPTCTRAFMTALDSIAGPMTWHPNYLERARS
jgi:hypothetical protein